MSELGTVAQETHEMMTGAESERNETDVGGRKSSLMRRSVADKGLYRPLVSIRLTGLTVADFSYPVERSPDI